MGRKLFIAFYFLCPTYILFNVAAWHNNELLSWDKGRYYLYLPATFIYHDPGRLDFMNGIDSTYQLNGGTKLYAIYKSPATGRQYTKYAIGVAVCELPVFLVTHFINKASGLSPPDGFSWLYQIGIGLSTIIFTVLGLLVLNKFLSQYFSPRSVLFTLILIALGTNLYSYTAFDQGMSHNFSFFFFAALLYLTDRWIKKRSMTDALLPGIVAGMIVIIRPVNIVVLIVPLVWLLSCHKEWRSQKKLPLAILLFAFSFLLVLLIQLSYWKYTTGQWVYYSYEGETFDFAHPHVWEGLFSYRKGWFVYTPVALLGICSIPLLWKEHRSFFWSLALFFPVIIYIVFCWHDWAYGGSFGCRPLIESLALLAIPLCALIEGAGKKTKPAKTVLYTVCILLIGLNIFQTYQFHHSVIDCCNMNRESYWRVFGKPEISKT